MKITIFGLAGTGTSTVGKLLASRLGFSYLSTGDIYFRKKAKELGITLGELHDKALEDPSIDRECDDAVEKFGKENNNFVVESRLAWHFIPDSIKVKLQADFKVRSGRLAFRDSLSIDQATEHIVRREEMDASRYKKFYGIDDINDDKHFDIIIDSGTSTPEEIVEEIISKLS